MEVPKYMQQGSSGPCVQILAAFLVKQQTVPCDFIPNQHFGQNLTKMLREYQGDEGLQVDGGCGPETRRNMKNYDFHFDDFCRHTTGVTKFVQPDGSVIEYDPAAP